MNCPEAKLKINALIDGQLEAVESSQLRRHLKNCKNCAAEYNFLRALSGKIADAPYYKPGAEFNDKVFAGLKLERNQSRIYKLSSRWNDSVSAAAALAAASWALAGLAWLCAKLMDFSYPPEHSSIFKLAESKLQFIHAESVFSQMPDYFQTLGESFHPVHTLIAAIMLVSLIMAVSHTTFQKQAGNRGNL